MTSITVWLIVFFTNTGQRVEMPVEYATEKECVAAAEAIQKAHPGVSTRCAATAVAVSEERARQLVNEEWWRSQPAEEEASGKKKP